VSEPDATDHSTPSCGEAERSNEFSVHNRLLLRDLLRQESELTGSSRTIGFGDHLAPGLGRLVGKEEVVDAPFEVVVVCTEVCLVVAVLLVV
jgi:hypothetical protein